METQNHNRNLKSFLNEEIQINIVCCFIELTLTISCCCDFSFTIFTLQNDQNQRINKTNIPISIKLKFASSASIFFCFLF